MSKNTKNGTSKVDYRVVVIGAGISGICAGVRLGMAGIDDFIILEKAEAVGGTWRENTYPGVACDVQSHFYSFSFEPWPNWSRAYAPGHEIWQYLTHCAEKYGLMRRIRFNTVVRKITFTGDHWVIEADGWSCTANAVIGALGGLHTPNIPKFAGIADFAGEVFHTARWNHDCDLTGRRVAVIGTGASGVQVVPEVAKVASKVSVFQRSPVWVMPKSDPDYSDAERARFRRVPWRARLHRYGIWRGWEKFSIDAGHDTPINRQLRKDGEKYIREQVPNQQVADLLVPKYPYGCKRPTLSNYYFGAFARDNVALVTAPIERMEKDGIRTTDGTFHAADVIVLATGFRAYDITNEVTIKGMGGLNLRDHWQEKGIYGYRSVMVPGFPNFFIMMGPNSAALTSGIEVIEAQVRFAVNCLRYLDKAGRQHMQPTVAATRAWNDMVQAGLANTLIAKDCRTWWTDTAGHNYVSWPHTSIRLKRAVKKPQPDEFEIA